MSAGDVRDQLAATIQAALMAHNGIVNGAGNVYMGAARDIDPHVFAGILLSLPWIAIVELPETHVDEVGEPYWTVPVTDERMPATLRIDNARKSGPRIVETCWTTPCRPADVPAYVGALLAAAAAVADREAG